MPTPVAMPDAIEPINPDIMPPPPLAGAAAGGGAAPACAGGGAIVLAGAGGGGAGAAERWGAEAEVRAPLRGMAGDGEPGSPLCTQGATSGKLLSLRRLE